MYPVCKPVRFLPSDFSTEHAYTRLVKGSPYLKSRRFTNEHQWKRYFLLSLGLMEGCTIISGAERSGKVYGRIICLLGT